MRTCSYLSTAGPRSLAQPGVSASFPPQQHTPAATCSKPPWYLHFMRQRVGPEQLPTPHPHLGFDQHFTAAVVLSLLLHRVAPVTHTCSLWSLPLSLFVFCFTAFFSLSPQSQDSAWSLPLQSDSQEGPRPPVALSLASAWSPLPTLAINWHTD